MAGRAHHSAAPHVRRHTVPVRSIRCYPEGRVTSNHPGRSGGIGQHILCCPNAPTSLEGLEFNDDGDGADDDGARDDGGGGGSAELRGRAERSDDGGGGGGDDGGVADDGGDAALAPADYLRRSVWVKAGRPGLLEC